MLRPLYRCLLRLHPEGFRQRYSEEMLWIFDESSGSGDRGVLVIDGLVSLARQWLARPANWKRGDVVPQVARSTKGVPMFQMVESTAPRPAVLLNGVVFSVGVFGALALVISNGTPSGSFQLPRVIIVPDNVAPESIPPLPVVDRPEAEAPKKPVGAGNHTEGLFEDSNEQVPVQAADLEKLTTLGRARVVVAAPPVRVRKRRAVRNGTPPLSLPDSANASPRPIDGGDSVVEAYGLLSLLDQDGNGALSVDEAADVSDRVRELLERADQNRDQIITLVELSKAISSSSASDSGQPSSDDMN